MEQCLTPRWLQWLPASVTSVKPGSQYDTAWCQHSIAQTVDKFNAKDII